MKYHNCLRENLNETNSELYVVLNKYMNNEDVEAGLVIDGYKALFNKMENDLYWTITEFYNTIMKHNSHSCWDYIEDITCNDNNKMCIAKNHLQIYIQGNYLEITRIYTDNCETEADNKYFEKYKLIYGDDRFEYPLICFDRDFNKLFQFHKFYIGNNPKLILGNFLDQSFETILYVIDNFNNFTLKEI